MSPTVHKILIYSAQILRNSAFPVAVHKEPPEDKIKIINDTSILLTPVMFSKE